MKRVVIIGIGLLGIMGCATQPTEQQQQQQQAGATILQANQTRIELLTKTAQTCLDGVHSMLVLCPHVDKSMPFKQGIDACVKEIQLKNGGK